MSAHRDSRISLQQNCKTPRLDWHDGSGASSIISSAEFAGGKASPGAWPLGCISPRPATAQARTQAPGQHTEHHHAPTTPTAPPTLISTPHLVDELCPGPPPLGAPEEGERGRRVGTGKLLRPQYSVVAWHSGLPSMGFASWQTEESVAGLVVFVSARIEHWRSDWGPRGRRGKIGISDWSQAAAWSSGFSSDSGVNLPSVVIWPCCRGQLWVRAPMLPCSHAPMPRGGRLPSSLPSRHASAHRLMP